MKTALLALVIGLFGVTTVLHAEDAPAAGGDAPKAEKATKKTKKKHHKKEEKKEDKAAPAEAPAAAPTAPAPAPEQK